MDNINLMEELGITLTGKDGIKEINNELAFANKLEDNDSDTFCELIRTSSKNVDKRFTDSGDDIGYYMAYSDTVTDLYPNFFGIDNNALLEVVNEDSGITYPEFLNSCYDYITSYIVNEEAFLDDFMKRVTLRNARHEADIEVDFIETQKLVYKRTEPILNDLFGYSYTKEK